MSAITGVKEREERREKFYSVQQEMSDDSDLEINEWENQQIRKGVTGTQLALAQNESVFSQYMIQPASVVAPEQNMSTGALLEQAYARNCLEKPKQMLSSTAKSESKTSGPRMPQEILQKVRERLTQVADLNAKHTRDIEEMTTEMKMMKIEALDCEQKAPAAAAKYRFYQELRGYVSDLVECLDEKVIFSHSVPVWTIFAFNFSLNSQILLFFCPKFFFQSCAYPSAATPKINHDNF